MPFTFSHPAIVLPLTYLPRKWFSLTGLIIGSLTPDFEYFMRMKIESNYSHTLTGLLWFDLPLGILLAFIFHNLVRNSLYDNLPAVLKSRFSAFKLFDWNLYFKHNWLVIIISILIGASSHLLWDSFTHTHGYFVKIIPGLTATIDIFGRQILVFKILQHASTLVGAFIIAYAIYKTPVDHCVKEKINPKYWIIAAGLSLAIILIRLLGGLPLFQYGNVIVTAISAGLISLILTPVFIKLR